jgi:hypothetical protein
LPLDPRSILFAPSLEIFLKPPRRRARRIASQTRELERLVFDLRGKGLHALREFGVEGLDF